MESTLALDTSRLGGAAVSNTGLGNQSIHLLFLAAREGFEAPKPLLTGFEAVMRRCGGFQTGWRGRRRRIEVARLNW